jgi:hypothetical protein
MKTTVLATGYKLAASFALSSSIVYAAENGGLPHHPVNDNTGSAIAPTQWISGILPEGAGHSGILSDANTAFFLKPGEGSSEEVDLDPPEQHGTSSSHGYSAAWMQRFKDDESLYGNRDIDLSFE